jgi:hypothetical protein
MDKGIRSVDERESPNEGVGITECQPNLLHGKYPYVRSDAGREL